MIKTGRAYVDIGGAAYDSRFHDRLVASLRRRAGALGYDLTSTTAA